MASQAVLIATLPDKVQRWRRMTLCLAALIIAIDGAFVLLVAYAKPFLSQPIEGPLTLGLLLGGLATIAGWLVAWCYIAWANHANPEDGAR